MDCHARIEQLGQASGIEPRDDPDDARARLAAPLRIVALGEVNAGKSTLLSALAGAEICPAGPLPTTRKTISYAHGDAEREEPGEDGWVHAARPLEYLKRFEMVDTPGSNSGWRVSVVESMPRFEQADLILMVFPSIPLETQLVLFGLASIVAVLAWRKYRETRPVSTDQPNLNRRGHQYIGRVFSLTEPIINGVGKVTVDDSTWKVKGPDLQAGTSIKVTGVEGVVFRVEAADS